MKKRTLDNKGETMIELVVSLALLALLVTMLATVFQASTRSLADTIMTKRDMNSQAGQLLLESAVEHVDNLTIQYQFAVDGSLHTDSFQVELIKAADGSLYKFR